MPWWGEQERGTQWGKHRTVRTGLTEQLLPERTWRRGEHPYSSGRRGWGGRELQTAGTASKGPVPRACLTCLKDSKELPRPRAEGAREREDKGTGGGASQPLAERWLLLGGTEEAPGGFGTQGHMLYWVSSDQCFENRLKGKSTGKGNQLQTTEILALGKDDNSDRSENWLAFLCVFKIELTELL